VFGVRLNRIDRLNQVFQSVYAPCDKAILAQGETEMEENSRRKFIIDSAKLAGCVVGASVMGTGFLIPQTAEAKEIMFTEKSFESIADTGKRILVAYDSDCGSTGGVAVAIGETLFESGNSVDVRCVRNIKNLQEYDAVVIGSPIQYDKWLDDAREFVEANKEVLSKIPVAYFFTCLVLSRRTEKSLQEAMELAETVYNVVPEVEPLSIGQFAGLLDYSKISFVKKMLLRTVLLTKKVKEGDYRDWDAIRHWAKGLELV
jgi:menaquinone-dependent protoporphyrinogen oxidase